MHNIFPQIKYFLQNIQINLFINKHYFSIYEKYNRNIKENCNIIYIELSLIICNYTIIIFANINIIYITINENF